MKEIAPEVGQVVKIVEGPIPTLERRGCGSTPDKCGVSASPFFPQSSSSRARYILENIVGDTPISVVIKSSENSGVLESERGSRTIYCASEKTVIKDVTFPETSPTS